MYRGTLRQTKAAVAHWNGLCEPAAAFVLNLGDIIDGQNSGGYGAGLDMPEPQSDVAMERVAGALSRSVAPVYHAIGNHELYNFKWGGIKERLQDPPRSYVTAPFSPAASSVVEPFSWTEAGWTFIMLNCYHVSIEQDPSLPGYQEALALMREHNPRCYEAIRAGEKPGDFFRGLTDEKTFRYVPFNGGLGAAQLEWLRKEVRAAVARDDKIVLLSHVPLYVGASSPRTLVYDADAAMELIHSEGAGHVVAVIAGHLHRGGYSQDDMGVHHVTLPSPLNYAGCYGHVNVFDDRLELKMVGSEAQERIPTVMPIAPPLPQTLKCVLESVP